MLAWFPAWYLVRTSRNGEKPYGVAFPDTLPADATRTLVHLFDLERRGNSRALVGPRHLRALKPGAFALYMARRTVRQ
jgi:hypothetical protein